MICIQLIGASDDRKQGTGSDESWSDDPYAYMATLGTARGRARPVIEDQRSLHGDWRVKQSVRQGKLVQFSRFQSCPAKVSRPAGIDVVVSGGNK